MKIVPRPLERRHPEVKCLRCHFVILLLLKMKREIMELQDSSCQSFGGEILIKLWCDEVPQR